MDILQAPISEAETPTEAAIWLPAIAAHIASFLPRNFVACTLRSLDKAASRQFSDVRTVQLSQQAPNWAFAEYWLAPESCGGLTLEQRHKLICKVAASGDVANLQVAIQAAGCLPTVEALEAAARAGALECCVHLTGVHPPPPTAWESALDAAAKSGRRAVCEWCLANGAKRNSWWAVTTAYSGGHPELEELLRPTAGDVPYDSLKIELLSGAAEGCSLEQLKRMWAEWGEQIPTFDDDDVNKPLCAAAGSPMPDWEARAELLLSGGLSFKGARGLPWDGFALRLPPDVALQRLEWMRLRGYAPGVISLAEAIKAGSPTCVEWMLGVGGDVGYRLDELAFTLCQVAPLEVVQLLVKRGVVSKVSVVRSAIMAGPAGLPVLRWMVDTYGPAVLDTSARGLASTGRWNLDAAARGGCVPAMELILEQGATHGLTLSTSCWTSGARSGCEAALEWLDRMGCPRPQDGGPYGAAAKNNDVRTLGVLRRLGLPWGESSGTSASALASAIGGGASLGTLRWLVAEGCPVDWAVARKAVEERRRLWSGGAEEVLAWIEQEEEAASA